MNPIDIINKYYPEENELRHILLTHSRSVADKSLWIADRHPELSLDKDFLYEAAMLDGASKWQQTRYITMPMLKTVIVMMFILSVGDIFASDFGLFYQVTQGVPNSLYKVASTFDTYVYAALQGNAPIGKTAAASTFQSVACCITILLTNFIVSKVDSDSAVF